jgi:hypothetical protein
MRADPPPEPNLTQPGADAVPGIDAPPGLARHAPTAGPVIHAERTVVEAMDHALRRTSPSRWKPSWILWSRLLVDELRCQGVIVTMGPAAPGAGPGSDRRRQASLARRIRQADRLAASAWLQRWPEAAQAYEQLGATLRRLEAEL